MSQQRLARVTLVTTILVALAGTLAATAALAARPPHDPAHVSITLAAAQSVGSRQPIVADASRSRVPICDQGVRGGLLEPDGVSITRGTAPLLRPPYDGHSHVYDRATNNAAARLSQPSPATAFEIGKPSWISTVASPVVALFLAAEGGATATTTAADILQDPQALEGLTPSQVDDLARNAGYDILPGKAGAANPATRYYVPGTNGSVGFRVLPSGVAGQAGIKGGAYLRFFGGPFAGLRIPLASP